jgi:hypothetical protein
VIEQVVRGAREGVIEKVRGREEAREGVIEQGKRERGGMIERRRE